MRKPLALGLGTALIASLLAATAPTAVAVPGDDSTVFINEFHYDNDGTDEGEFVEVAGPAGTDLAGWDVVLYNGSNGAVYDSDELSVTLTDQGNGYGTTVLDYPANGIQNGSPDGIALVDASDTLVQFLSYEGTFTAVGGPADGETSADVGVDEAGTTPVGQSLQLTGTGSSYGDFTWTGPVEDSPGSPNTGQTFTAPDNAPIITDCDDVTLDEGKGGSAQVSASDADGTVTGAEITSEPVEGISLTDVVPADGDGGTLTATLTVDEDVPLGMYDVSVTFTNDDDDEPQSATCTVQVSVAPPTDVATPISDVQGSGDSSPLAGFTVMVETVVTSVLLGDEEGDQIGGFFIEEEAGDRDDDPQSSEGLFVFAGAQSGNLDLETGDLVQVTGQVQERFGQTQINASSGTIEVVGTATLPEPAVLTELPEPTEEARAAAWEPLEGMRVRLGGTWTVTDNFVTHTFGELEILPSSEPLQTPTNVMEPGPEAGAIEDAILANYLSITLDDTRDGNLVEQGLPAPYFSEDGTGTIRRGSTLDDQVTIMSYGFGSYRLRPVDTEDTLVFDYDPRPAAPDVDGDVTMAAFNVLNYFNGDGMGGGFPTPRGADTPEEFERQAAKIVAAIDAIDADALGLMEIENDGYGQESAIQDLLDRLNAVAEEGEHYAAVEAGGEDGLVGTDAIAVAFIYRPDVLELDGFDTLEGVGGFGVNSRVPIAARFTERATGGEVVGIVNHFKSKGGGGAEGANLDQGDGQGAYNGDRTRAAQALVEWTETDEFFDEDDRILVIGDLNAYAEEDPIDVFTEDNGYTDLLDVFYDDSDREAYTFAFFGAEGRLDHLLANPEAVEVVEDAAVWHHNADEPRAKDYTFFNQPELYEPDAYRSSDHDAVLVGLQLGDIEPAVVADLSVDIRATPTRGAKAGTAPLRFTVRVSNDGPQTAPGTVVEHELTLPPGAVVERVDVPSGTSFDNETLTWTIGDLEAGATERLVIVVRTTRESVGEATLTATVDSDAVDPNEGDNTDTAEVTVDPPPGGGRGGRGGR